MYLFVFCCFAIAGVALAQTSVISTSITSLFISGWSQGFLDASVVGSGATDAIYQIQGDAGLWNLLLTEGPDYTFWTGGTASPSTTFQCATSTKDAVVLRSCAMEFTGSDAIVTTSELSFTPGQWIVPVTITAGLENLSNFAATQTSSASTSKNPPTGPSQTSNPTTSGTAGSSPSSAASSGLSIGAKAGIGVSVAIVALLVLCLLLFFLLRRRRQVKHTTESTNDLEPAGRHELGTKSNTHELLTKEKAGEMNGNPNDQTVEQNYLHSSEICQQAPHEVDATPLSHGPNHGLGGKDVVEIGGPASRSPQPISRKAVDVQSSETEASGSQETEEQKEEKLRVLEQKIEKIREDKERLSQLQRLTEMEEETKREIMDVRLGVT